MLWALATAEWIPGFSAVPSGGLWRGPEGKGCLGFAACLPILMFGDGNEIMNCSCYRVARPLACEILVMPVR